MLGARKMKNHFLIESLAEDPAANNRIDEKGTIKLIHNKSSQERVENYHAIAGENRDPIIIHQTEQILYVNQAFSSVFGYSPDEVIGTDPYMLIHPDEAREKLRTYGRARLQGEIRPISYEAQMVRSNGEFADVFLFNQVMQVEKDPVIVTVARDISGNLQAEQEFQNTAANLRKAMGGTIQLLALTVETKDPYTAGHQKRTADLARSIATEMNLSAEKIDGIRMAGVIHDIGKIGIPSEILSKPGQLNDLEYALVKTHSQAGYDLLSTIEFPWPIADMVHQHHERMNGSGYPLGIAGDDILFEARILAVADVVEAMASHRPYRPSLGVEKALEEISQNKGLLYDSQVVDACLWLFNEKGYHFI